MNFAIYDDSEGVVNEIFRKRRYARIHTNDKMLYVQIDFADGSSISVPSKEDKCVPEIIFVLSLIVSKDALTIRVDGKSASRNTYMDIAAADINDSLSGENVILKYQHLPSKENC